MSELIQIQKKTAVDIFPHWCDAIQNFENGYKVLSPLLGVNSNCCVVGEAHGFRGAYTYMGLKESFCNECSSYAYKMVNRNSPHPGRIAIKLNYNQLTQNEEIADIDYQLYETLKEQFVDHWNNKHAAP